jgi:hypothetical protein
MACMSDCRHQFATGSADDPRVKRFAAILYAFVGALVLASGALAAPSSTPSTSGAAAAPSAPVQGHVSGTVIGVDGRTFAIETSGGRMPVVQSLTDAANLVTTGDFPYVYGGGHAQAGIASIGIKGPGYNGRRIGFDCSGSVAAVLAGAGLWPVAGGVPNDAGVVAQLLREHLIARGRGHGAGDVTFYDDPGVHIFMDIDGHFFGTSDGGGGGNPSGGAGWLDDGAPDAHSRTYKAYHLLAGPLGEPTTLERIFTFQTAGQPGLVHGLQLGSDVHVGYTQAPNGRLTAQSVK